MRYLTLGEVVDLHRPPPPARGDGQSASAQPKATFGGVDLYPALIETAAALCFSLVRNHPFVGGNTPVGHAAMETFLVLNDAEIDASRR